MRPRDTSPAAHQAQLRCYRRMSGAQKVALAAQLSDDVRAVALAGICARHPRVRRARGLVRAAAPPLGRRPLRPRLAPRAAARAVTAGDFLARLVALLEAAGIPHMVAGLFASTFHGVARATQDLELVIDPTGAALDAFLASLDPDVYYVDPDTARDALRHRSQFNVIDMTTGWKASFTTFGGSGLRSLLIWRVGQFVSLKPSLAE